MTLDEMAAAMNAARKGGWAVTARTTWRSGDRLLGAGCGYRGVVTMEHVRDYYARGVAPAAAGRLVWERGRDRVRRLLKAAGLIEYRVCADGKRRWVRTVDGVAL